MGFVSGGYLPGDVDEKEGSTCIAQMTLKWQLEDWSGSWKSEMAKVVFIEGWWILFLAYKFFIVNGWIYIG